ncbi:Os10g0402600 [Oryza sativa Japonica Group]|uniref:Os10g0402600 protein n=1 Tax=Oryza sativa subsp. japonica TaxID=39947 RepID=A0A0P0XUP6_ORYSJ|nr:Os10g0402600 [Oryza sativa Japonica Group]
MAWRWRPSHLVLMARAAYLIFLKFRRMLDLATADLAATDEAFSSPSSDPPPPPRTRSWSPPPPPATGTRLPPYPHPPAKGWNRNTYGEPVPTGAVAPQCVSRLCCSAEKWQEMCPSTGGRAPSWGAGADEKANAHR